MTKKEAIKILSQRGWDGLPHGYTGGYVEALDMAIEALKQTQWIPCEEKLPETWKDILLSIGDNVYEAHLRESKEYFVTHRDTRFIRAEEPIAWMLLPKSWKGEIE